jgi:hypothetical protein
MNQSIIDYLNLVLPGQPADWYTRIARDVLAGKMPLPKIDGVPVPPALVPIEPTINPARQRFLGNSKPAPPNVPETVGQALQQARRGKKPATQPARAETKWKLDNLVHSDCRAADRLVAQIAFSHPNRSEQWCYEKAILDLERDRF